MYDLSVPNDTPGPCAKCHGSGVYAWGACVNGKMQHEGPRYACRGAGRQDRSDIKRNEAYNRHKIARMIEGGADGY